jgi:hypothetical protein
MQLTLAQQQALKAHLLSNQEIAQTYIDGNLPGVADYMNAASDPAFIVWKSFVSRDDVMLNGFDWTRVDNLSVGKARIWDWINQSGGFNPSKANIRAGIDATWTGTAADLAVRAAVYVHCKRSASRVEKLFATGTGTTNDPATMAVEGALTSDDISALQNV